MSLLINTGILLFSFLLASKDKLTLLYVVLLSVLSLLCSLPSLKKLKTYKEIERKEGYIHIFIKNIFMTILMVLINVVYILLT